MLLSTPRTCSSASAANPESLETFNVPSLSDSLLRLPLIPRIALLTLTVSLLVGLCLYPVYLQIAESRTEHAAERKAAALGDLLAIAITPALESRDMDRAAGILRSMARDPQVTALVLLDQKQRVLSSYPDPVRTSVPATPELGGGGIHLGGNYSLWRPLLVEGSPVGSLYLELELPLKRVRYTLLWFVAGFGLTWSLALTLVLSYLRRRRLTQPLAQIANASRQLADGDFEVLLPSREPGEVGDLADQFGQMVESLRAAAQVNREAVDVLESIEDPIIMVDEELRIAQANPAARRLLGYEKNELPGMHAAWVIEMSRQDGTPRSGVTELAKVRNGECNFVCKNGQRVPMIFSGTTLETQAGRRVIVAAHDLTQRVRQEDYLREAAARAEQANRAKSQFLAKMSHELRTPLNAILGFAQIQKARLDKNSPDYLVKNTEHTLSAGWHLLNLINDVLDIARIEENNLRLAVEECKLGEVVSHSRSLVLSDAKSAGIRIEVEDSPLLVQADYTRLKQVFVNLFSNAIKYNRDGGSVNFRAHQLEDGRVQCEISDTGVGISPEDADTLFEPFTRLQYAESNDIQGTGIGLALTRLLLELMRGKISFSSEPGKGTIFYVELQPVPQQRELIDPEIPRQAVEETELSVAGGALTIFYVEDNPASLELMKAIMDPLPGVTLLTSTTAEEGIELAYKYLPDLIILDINLPGGMDGVAAATALRASDTLGHIPLVALSADATRISIDAALAAGFDDYLTKPLDIEKLMRVIGALPVHAQRNPQGQEIEG